MASLCLTVAGVFFYLCHLPTAPAAVLAAPWGPPLSVVGAAVTAATAAVTAARAAAWRASLVRARVRIRVQNLVLSEMAGVGRRAIAVSEAGLVSAARSAAGSLLRSFSLRVQGPGLARRIPV